MHRILAPAVLLLLASLGLAQEAGKTQARIQKRTYEFKEAKKDMEYALFVSSKYDKNKKAPLLVALHGLESNPQQILRYKGLTDLAEKYGYVAVAPMGYNSSGWYETLPARSRKSLIRRISTNSARRM